MTSQSQFAFETPLRDRVDADRLREMRSFAPAQARREGAKHKPTQCDRILALLETGKWVSLPQILELGVAQYNARIWELRNRYGLVIECETREVDGQTHSWYRLVLAAAQGEK